MTGQSKPQGENQYKHTVTEQTNSITTTIAQFTVFLIIKLIDKYNNDTADYFMFCFVF
jgi:lactate dehydrogenase-like 2-hydroxyacid dehydrogenase